MDEKFQLLDCTLRDGSYVNNFSFTATDTHKIVDGLDKLKFDFIEVGHGIGLGASKTTKFKAVASDSDYMTAANAATQNSKWGMFCIPGVACLDDLRLAADHNIDFVRIGSELDKVSSTFPFIELAHKLNIEVFVNFMKSYVVPPQTFAEIAHQAIDKGVKLIYLVDSSGSMLPSEIKNYISTFQDRHPDTDLGFHGHDNLRLSISNALVCLNEGVKIVDTSIQGYGRGAGNTPAEELISVLIRNSMKTNIDHLDLFNFSEEITPYLRRNMHWSALDVVSGLAGFHSSYTPKILSIANKYSLDPKEVILELCKINKSNAPDSLLESVATKLQDSGRKFDKTQNYKRYFGEEQS